MDRDVDDGDFPEISKSAIKTNESKSRKSNVRRAFLALRVHRMIWRRPVLFWPRSISHPARKQEVISGEKEQRKKNRRRPIWKIFSFQNRRHLSLWTVKWIIKWFIFGAGKVTREKQREHRDSGKYDWNEKIMINSSWKLTSWYFVQGMHVRVSIDLWRRLLLRRVGRAWNICYLIRVAFISHSRCYWP